jgi:hypothetical protein
MLTGAKYFYLLLLGSGINNICLLGGFCQNASDLACKNKSFIHLKTTAVRRLSHYLSHLPID